ncbi:Protein N-acetyltransferase, RimJ/RimL family [Cellulomonas marina]|uniref:Protein N-acetyltransferase, RimJ/RimL family n=2 Tax=Cellulomonas marina TaxID=988821 RepID=A0A1I1A699_9CELL|nr:Protein N-acetyltransferase, RimJ/RimL family [Cellulomonas marina]
MAYGRRLLRGEQVTLRPTAEEDLPALVAFWTAPDFAVLQTGPYRPRPTAATVAQFRTWSANESPASVGFSVVTDDDRLAGHVTLSGLELPTRIVTLGVVMGAEHVSHGIGTDAVRVAVRYAFAEMGAHKVELQAWAFNDRALAAYEKAGFVREGVRRAAVLHDGRFHDEVLMGLLAEEWSPA